MNPSEVARYMEVHRIMPAVEEALNVAVAKNSTRPLAAIGLELLAGDAAPEARIEAAMAVLRQLLLEAQASFESAPQAEATVAPRDEVASLKAEILALKTELESLKTSNSASAGGGASPAAGTTPPDSKDVGPTEWTTAGWLASTGGAIDALALSLSSGRAAEQSELEFVRGLGTKGTGATPRAARPTSSRCCSRAPLSRGSRCPAPAAPPPPRAFTNDHLLYHHPLPVTFTIFYAITYPTITDSTLTSTLTLHRPPCGRASRR